MRQSPGASLAYLAFACSIAIACAGAAAGGQHGGGHDGGGQHGGGHDSGGHHGEDGGHDPGSHNDEGHNGSPHKGPGGDPGDPARDPPSDDDGTSTITTGAVAPTTAAKAATVDPFADGGQSLDLPPALQPPEDSTILSAVNPIEAVPGVPDDVVRACHDAIEQAAAPFGATSVRVASAGSMHRLSRHTISAPVQVSIDYVRQDSVETRQAPVGCELNAKGSVIGLT